MAEESNRKENPTKSQARERIKAGGKEIPLTLQFLIKKMRHARLASKQFKGREPQSMTAKPKERRQKS